MKHKSLDDKSSLSDGLSHRCVDCLIKHLCCQGEASGFLVSGYLIPTTKAAVEKYNLCKKYGAKCALDAVVNKKTRELKRIILG